MKLNHKPQLLPATLLVIGLCMFLASCSKDTDLLSEYVTNGENLDFASINIIDDNFNISYGTQEVLNVLENDNIIDPLSTNITSVSDPLYGSVTLKVDNTLVYYAPGASTAETETVVTTSEGESEGESDSDNETDEESAGSNTTEEQDSNNTTEEQQTDESTTLEDSFTYTTETEDEDGEITTETGTVTVIVNSTENIDLSSSNLIYTIDAKVELKRRFENGYITGPGFNDDIKQTIEDTKTFTSNPSEYRPFFGDGSAPHSSGQSLHTTALYAYAIDSVELANIVAEELIGIVNNNNLYTTFWTNSETVRWDSDFNGWIQTAKATKMKDSYNFIKHLQTTLSESEKTQIENWFERFKDLAYKGFKNRIESFFGSGWTVDNFPKPYYTSKLWDAPLHETNGDIIDIRPSLSQDVYNNRHWDIVTYIHSWAVENNDRDTEEYCRNFFKVFFKYGIFPDGTIWEIMRNTNSNFNSGVGYGMLTMSSLVSMAHLDAMANHFPDDLLYDYTTTEGVRKGEIGIASEDAYQGSSTTDGETEKGLLMFIKAQSKYLRSEADGGWSDIRFYNGNSLDMEGWEQPSTIPAIANLYYRDQDLVDFYLYNTSVGYPQKQSLRGGYQAPLWDKDTGAWGNMIFGAAWLEQENNFFN